jgi:predicted dehydrogenase
MVATCSIDCANVVIPHYQYSEIVKHLAKTGIHVLKERPDAMSVPELESFQALASSNSVTLTTAS